MPKLENSIRVFLQKETLDRLILWANYHGYSLSRACRVIIDSAPLYVPVKVDIDADTEPNINN